MPDTAPISVLIPTWRRTRVLGDALDHILGCSPLPCEILVHVDAGDDKTAPMLEREYAGKVRWVQSAVTQGPGGGRNRLVQEASAQFYASFDDDSWPVDADYFGVACNLLEQHPDAAVITGQVSCRNEREPERSPIVAPSGCFEGGSHVGRVNVLRSIHGYVPLRHAYGLEEADVALQLLDAGWKILRSHELRIFHDSDLQHHGGSAVNAAQIRNTALKVFLRYPPEYWPLGILQTLNRVCYALKMRRFGGILSGLVAIPAACYTYRRYRQVVKASTVRKSRDFARLPQ